MEDSQVAAQWVILRGGSASAAEVVVEVVGVGEVEGLVKMTGLKCVDCEGGLDSRPRAACEESPALRSAPEDVSRRVWFPPARMVTGPGLVEGLKEESKRTCLGTETSSLWPIPSCPEPLEPIAYIPAIFQARSFDLLPWYHFEKVV